LSMAIIRSTTAFSFPGVYIIGFLRGAKAGAQSY
jgi:hypothetical protein